MKKIGLGLIGLILAAAIYYFAIGASRLTQEVRMHVDTQLASLQKEGFKIEQRHIKEKKEHFIISFDDTRKISTFLYRKGVQITAEDAEMFKGLKLGVDIHYLPDISSLLSLDIYPHALPHVITTSLRDKRELLKQIEEILKNKTLLIHLMLNKTASSFKGHMKDINETIKDAQQMATLHSKELTFEGKITKNSIYAFKQTLQNLSFILSDGLKISLSGLKSNYKVTGKTLYDYTTNYQIEEAVVDIQSITQIRLRDIRVDSASIVKENLASGTMKISIAQTNITNSKKPYDLEHFNFEVKASNIDISTIDQMQQADLSNEKVMNSLLKQLFSKGVVFEVTALSLEHIKSDGKKIEGFDLAAQLTFAENFDFPALERNPLSALNAINADAKLTFSNELFALMAEQPPIMMVLMMFPPKDKHNKKEYILELKKGNVTVNGKTVM